MWGHEEAFRYFGGVPRVILYDNLKSAVTRRRGDAINYNETLLAFSAHHGFEPRPVAPYRGNEKGRVERAVRYVRDSLFAALSFHDLEALNEKSLLWMNNIARARPWTDDKTMTVGEVHDQERDRLRPLSSCGFAIDERCEVSIGKQPYARFERNDYSVPSELVQRTLVVFAAQKLVRIFDGEKLVAEHPRNFDKGSVIESEEHLRELKSRKRRAKKGMALDLLHRAVPQSQELICILVDRGENIGAMVGMIMTLLETFGSGALIEAVAEALSKGSPHPSSLRHILERKREERKQLPAVAVDLPNDPKVRGLVVRPHDLSAYDFGTEKNQDEHDEEKKQRGESALDNQETDSENAD